MIGRLVGWPGFLVVGKSTKSVGSIGPRAGSSSFGTLFFCVLLNWFDDFHIFCLSFAVLKCWTPIHWPHLTTSILYHFCGSCFNDPFSGGLYQLDFANAYHRSILRMLAKVQGLDVFPAAAHRLSISECLVQWTWNVTLHRDIVELKFVLQSRKRDAVLKTPATTLTRPNQWGGSKWLEKNRKVGGGASCDLLWFQEAERLQLPLPEALTVGPGGQIPEKSADGKWPLGRSSMKQLALKDSAASNPARSRF